MRDGVVLRITPSVLTAEAELLLEEFFGGEVTGRILTAEVFDLVGLSRNIQGDCRVVGYAMAELGWLPAHVKVTSRTNLVSYAYVRGTTFEQRKQWLTIVDDPETGLPKLIKEHPLKPCPVVQD